MMRRMLKARQTSETKWRSPFPSICCTMLFILIICIPSTSGDHEEMTEVKKSVFKAKFNISYYNESKQKMVTISKELGKYALDSEKSTKGQLIHVVGRDNSTTGCKELVNPVSPKWIALVERGICSMKDKMINVKKYNASGIVIYDHETRPKDGTYQRTTIEAEKGLVAVFVTKADGRWLLTLFESGRPVQVHLQQGPYVENIPPTTNPNPHNISKTSVLFVSISFIVLMIISLAWLVFYYIQRFRYAHAKERLTRRLANAAKKAIAKIPQRTIKSGDKELESEFDQCAVCIEGYKTSDVIRILPCKHIFHKSCVDPWLLDQRSCPMCKLDILREYGMQVHIGGSQETVHAEGDSGGTGSGLHDDPEQLSSPDEHSQNEAMNIVLIRHPSLHYHGSDTFCDEVDEAGLSERAALNPQPIECQTDIIQGDIDMDSESECTEMNALMTGRPHSDSLCDTSSHSQA